VGSTGITLFVVAVAVEGAAWITFLTLWLVSRQRHARTRQELAAALDATGRTRRPRRRLPAPDQAVKAVWETANLVRDKGFGGALRSSIEDLAGWAQVERPALVQLAGRDGRVAILFSDIEGSTELNERLGDKEWVRLLARHDAVLRSAIERHGGQVVKTQGDGFMAAFGEAEHAVRAAVAVQRAFEKGAAKGKAAVNVRIGVHQGDVVHRDNDIFGRNVAQAARVAGLADGGEILVSDTVAEALAAYDDLPLGPPRAVRLKGLAGEHLVTEVTWRAD
jgi:adenylate cyclase